MGDEEEELADLVGGAEVDGEVEGGGLRGGGGDLDVNGRAADLSPFVCEVFGGDVGSGLRAAESDADAAADSLVGACVGDEGDGGYNRDCCGCGCYYFSPGFRWLWYFAGDAGGCDGIGTDGNRGGRCRTRPGSKLPEYLAARIGTESVGERTNTREVERWVDGPGRDDFGENPFRNWLNVLPREDSVCGELLTRRKPHAVVASVVSNILAVRAPLPLGSAAGDGFGKDAPEESIKFRACTWVDVDGIDGY